jgi:[ribosomal protein S18]-alanine N-acetyltransferase
MSEPAPQISLATPGDVDALTLLEPLLFHTDRCSRRSFQRLIRQGRVVVVREKEQSILGYAIMLARRNSRKMRIYSFGIADSSRRRGLAGALLAKLEDIATAADCHTLILEVGDTNTAAMSFYSKHGFCQCGFRLHYYQDGGHAILMRKSLTPKIMP